MVKEGGPMPVGAVLTLVYRDAYERQTIGFDECYYEMERTPDADDPAQARCPPRHVHVIDCIRAATAPHIKWARCLFCLRRSSLSGFNATGRGSFRGPD